MTPRAANRFIKRARSGAFSLLEVMVAIAILGLALTVILSAQGGLAASNRHSSCWARLGALPLDRDVSMPAQ